MESTSKIYLAGHTGLVGSAIYRNLKNKGYQNIVTRELDELDLTNQQATANFFSTEMPEYVMLAAAKVGGIMANNIYRAQFIYENLMIQNNVIHQAYLNNTKKLLFLGSSCVYPKSAPQPIKEEYLLNDELEYTNEPYAIAKIAGIKTCESYNLQYNTDFISVMPTNLYGPNDNYDLEKSHVLPAMIRKIYLSKCIEDENWEGIKNDLEKRPVRGLNSNADNDEILKVLANYGIERGKLILWGTGNPLREFMHVDDMADACIFLMEQFNFKNLVSVSNTSASKEIKNTHVNIGTGTDISIKDLALLIQKVIGFKGSIEFDSSHPDGTLRKLLDVTKLNQLGWHHKIHLQEGIEKVYDQYTKA